MQIKLIFGYIKFKNKIQNLDLFSSSFCWITSFNVRSAGDFKEGMLREIYFRQETISVSETKKIISKVKFTLNINEKWL